MESKLFNGEEDDLLIDLVRKNPVIFDYSLKNYKDAVLKRNAWKKIAAELGKEEEECRVRWKTIRDTYRRNMNRLHHRLKTGSLAFPRSKYLNKNLNFLEKCIKTRRVKPNRSCQSCATVDDANSSDHQDNLETDPSGYVETQVTDAYNHQEDTARDEEIFEDDEMQGDCSDFDNEGDADEVVETEETNKGKKKNSKENVIEEIKPGRDELSKILNSLMTSQINKPQKEHSVDLFFRSMAEVVKQFPPHIIAEARLKVCQVVSELECRALQENT